MKQALVNFRDWWFRVRAFEVPLYKRLGVRGFKALMLRLVGTSTARRLGWHPLHDREGSFQQAVDSYRSRSVQDEFVHWVALAVLAGLTANLALGGRVAEASVVVVINIPFNVYPIMLQRQIRHRLIRVRRPNA